MQSLSEARLQLKEELKAIKDNPELIDLCIEQFDNGTGAVLSRAQVLVDALEKIEDPRKRDHKEPDAYTELGCVMNIATEALETWRESVK